MAILSFYQCEVLVNGTPLPEYDDDDTADVHDHPVPLAVKYIEATAGSDFAIKFSLLPGWKMEDDLAWSIILDGSVSQGTVIEKARIPPGMHSKIRDSVKFGSGNDWHVKKYTFGSLVLGENTGRLTAQEMKAKYSNLGTIRVEVWHYKLHYVRPIEQSSFVDLSSELGVVPEKALKGQALSLSAGLSKSVKSRSGVGSCVGTYGKLLAAFEFRYRSKEALQQLMILPPDIPLEEKRIEDLTAEEARELLRRERAQANTAGKVKSEDTHPNLKRERASTTTTNARPLKISRASDGREYIDLASDSEDDSVKEDGRVLGKDTKKTNATVEVLDRLE